MPKRIIDFDAIWTSGKLAQCAPSHRVEYLWIYGLADGTGSFEMTSMRAIHARVSVIRADFTLRKLKSCLADFQKHGLLFSWTQSRKLFGHWVGSRMPGRLPPPSTIGRHYVVCPYPPMEQLKQYEDQYKGHDLRIDRKIDHSNDMVVGVGGGGELGVGSGRGNGSGAPSAHAANPAADRDLPEESEEQTNKPSATFDKLLEHTKLPESEEKAERSRMTAEADRQKKELAKKFPELRKQLHGGR